MDALNVGCSVIWHGRMPSTIVGAVSEGRWELICWSWRRTYRFHNVMLFSLPVVLYGWETWPLTLREEHGLRMFENRMLRRIFGPKRDEMTGGRGKVRNEELHNLYFWPIRTMKSRRMRWAGHVAPTGEKGRPYWILVRRPEGKRPLGRPRHSESVTLLTSDVHLCLWGIFAFLYCCCCGRYRKWQIACW
jgi:PAS domain-containing protein